MRERDEFSPASHVWCDACKRNGRVHSHKCRECDHVEDGDWTNSHRDGLCFHCHPMNARLKTWAAEAAEIRRRIEEQQEGIS